MPPNIEHPHHIDLPDAAHHPSEDDFEEPNYLDKSSGPQSISELEQLYRVAFIIGGRNNGLELAEKATEFQRKHEKENIFGDFNSQTSSPEDSKDLWLQSQLEDIEKQIQAILKEKEKMHERREAWFDDRIEQELPDKLRRATKMLRDGVKIETYTIVEDRENNTEEDTLHKTELNNEIPFAEYGYLNFPATFLVVTSPDSGNKYPLLPWFGTTTCTCGYKQDNPVSTLCKHEIAALLEFSKDQFNPDGPRIPERHKRLMSPQAYKRFKDNINP